MRLTFLLVVMLCFAVAKESLAQCNCGSTIAPVATDTAAPAMTYTSALYASAPVYQGDVAGGCCMPQPPTCCDPCCDPCSGNGRRGFFARRRARRATQNWSNYSTGPSIQPMPSGPSIAPVTSGPTIAPVPAATIEN